MAHEQVDDRPARSSSAGPCARRASSRRAARGSSRTAPAPHRRRSACSATGRRSRRRSTARNPPTTSLWPPRYFVAECTTTSAPSVSGCWRYGVANVLSTTTSAPRSWASCATASMSIHVSSGLVGVSSQTTRVSSGHAAASASTSVRSTADHSTPSGDQHVGDQAIGAAVGVVAEQHPPAVCAGGEAAQHRVLGGEPAGEREPVLRLLERRHARLERGAGRVARSRVLVAAVDADGLLGERRRQRQRDDHRPGGRVGVLAGVDRRGSRTRARSPSRRGRCHPRGTRLPTRPR